MPPKPKFTREEIVSAALDIVSKKGIESLTAKELKTMLNSSASPIFTVFSGMEEIRREVRSAAMRRFENYTETYESNMPVFKQIGMKMISFGINEPKLFQLLFMTGEKNADSFDDVFGALGKTAAICIETIESDYNLNNEQAKMLFENMWIYTFGISVLCATGVCGFSTERLGKMLTTEFNALMAHIKSENK